MGKLTFRSHCAPSALPIAASFLQTRRPEIEVMQFGVGGRSAVPVEDSQVNLPLLCAVVSQYGRTRHTSRRAKADSLVLPAVTFPPKAPSLVVNGFRRNAATWVCNF